MCCRRPLLQSLLLCALLVPPAAAAARGTDPAPGPSGTTATATPAATAATAATVASGPSGTAMPAATAAGGRAEDAAARRSASAAANGAVEPVRRGAERADEWVWDARKVEHLLNRAGFGVRPRHVALGVELGQEALVDWLFTRTLESDTDPFFVQIFALNEALAPEMTDAELQEVKQRIRRQEAGQLRDYGAWWVDRMLGFEDPLRDRMALFWHGHFTSSSKVIRRTYELLRQHQMLRENALESYADMLHAIVRDPAMIYYLDNHQNRKGRPNENLARELMELFSLGEGSYTEEDVKEAARALTGYHANKQGDFVFNRKQHDRGPKTILGRTGRWNGDDLVEILLADPACARYAAGEIIAYLEGVEPEPARRDRYARILRESEYELEPMLRALFLDRDFYRAEIVGRRVQGPVDWLVGTSLRLNVHPPAHQVVAAATLLGQELFAPPNVKGWEEGMAWITTSSFLQRGNLAGLLLGVIDFEDMVEPEAFAAADAPGMDPGGMDPGMDGDAGAGGMDPRMDDEPGMAGGMDAEPGMDDGMAGMDGGMDAAMDPQAEREARQRLAGVYRAVRNLNSGAGMNVNLSSRVAATGATGDAAIVDALLDALLAVEAAPVTRELLVRYLAAQRERLGVAEGRLLERGQDAELVLRRLAHQILSTPEAQLG